MSPPFAHELHNASQGTDICQANASKTDSLLAQNPDKSLDQLVADKVLNNDQKAQILKKPALKSQLAQTEEQLAQYLKVDEQYRTRAAADKAEWEKSLEKAKTDAVSEAQASFEKSQRANLLLLSQFLRLAAYRREEAADPESDESQAVEGVLLAIYTGDENAVNAMLKLVEGSSDQILSVPGEQLQTTCMSGYPRLLDKPTNRCQTRTSRPLPRSIRRPMMPRQLPSPKPPRRLPPTRPLPTLRRLRLKLAMPSRSTDTPSSLSPTALKMSRLQTTPPTLWLRATGTVPKTTRRSPRSGFRSPEILRRLRPG